MSFRCTLTVVVLCLSLSATYSQDVKKPPIVFLSGSVYDMQSLEKMSLVNISINKSIHLLSDENGHYEAYILTTDTVTFSYYGYETAVISLSDTKLSADTFYMEILMQLKPHEIPEATIVPYTSYSQFKNAFIHLNPESMGETNAKINSDIVQSQVKGNIVPDNDAQSATKNLMIMKDYNNNSIIFFSSSDPNKGIIGALKALGITKGKSRR